MTVVHTFADVEQLLVGWAPTVTTVRALTETPSDLASVLPVVRITRIGGPVGDPGFDQPTVDFDCFAATRPAAKALAIVLMSAVLYRLVGFTNPYGMVLETGIRSGPSIRPWLDTNIRRVGFTASLIVNSSI